MTRPVIFIGPDLRPDMTKAIEPVDVEDVIRGATARGAALRDKQDGVASDFLVEETGKEMSEPGPDPQTGKEASEPEPTGKEASDALAAEGRVHRIVRFGELEAVRDFIRPIM